MIGNRGIYHKGWTAVTKHRTPWVMGLVKTIPFDDDVWELYDTAKDWTQTHDLSKDMPDKLHELQRLWLIEATKYNVLPLDDRMSERCNPDISGRPQLIRGNRQMLYGGMKRLSPHSIVSLGNKSFALTAEVVVPDAGATGVIFALGGITGGMSLYVKEGIPTYCYNFLGLKYFIIRGTQKIPKGKHQLRLEFAYDGKGLGKGGTVSFFIDGKKCGEGRVEMTQPFAYSADETADVGMEAGSPVSPEYGSHDNAFNGTINWLEIDVDKAALDQDHILSPEERFRVAMTFQ
jgi:arylsulfatase